MMKQMNLLGKTQHDVNAFTDKIAKDMFDEFNRTHDTIDYHAVYTFIQSHGVFDNLLFVHVKKLSLSDVSDDMTLGQAKKMVTENNEAYKLYQKVKYSNPAMDVISMIIAEYVRASFPNMTLTDKQVSALTSAAYEEGHSAGYLEVLSYLDDYINMTKAFLDKD